MVENNTQILVVKTRPGFIKKYKRACNIRDHQKRKRLQTKWNNIANRYYKKYTTEKCIVGSTVVNIIDRTDYTMLGGDYYSPIVITCNKGPEN